ncbi:hypothetical protein QE152_g25003 [Popillia japonica]|uniref:Uncharacterized protein n=1 Tax=Popillia japonica TaxID=7064 RepID=A0AAW1K2H6_POPJA
MMLIGINLLGRTIVSRACETGKFRGCYSINGGDFCFCHSNLCNGLNYNFESDDEELEEGSGTEPPPQFDATTELIPRKSSNANVLKSVILPVYLILWLI